MLKKHLYTVLMLIAIAILIYVADSNSLLSLILIPISLILIFSPEHLIPLILVTSWSSGFTVIPGFSGFYYLLIILFVSILLKSNFEIIPKFNITSILLITFALFIDTTAFFSVAGTTYWAFKTSVVIIVIVLINKEINFNLRLCCKLLLLASILAICYYFYKFNFAPSYYLPLNANEDYLSYRLSFSEDINPNNAAVGILLLTIILLTNVISFNCKWLVLPYLIAFEILFATGSRTSILVSIIVLFLLIFFFSHYSFRKKILWGIFVAFFGFFVLSFISGLFGSIADRFDTSAIVSEGASGRFFTWSALISNVIPNNFWIGIGFGNENLFALGYTADADNILMDLLSQVGIIGTMLFFGIIYKYGKTMIVLLRDNKYLLLPFILFISVLITGIGESVFDSEPIWCCMLFSQLAITTTIQNKKKPVYDVS